MYPETQEPAPVCTRHEGVPLCWTKTLQSWQSPPTIPRKSDQGLPRVLTKCKDPGAAMTETSFIMAASRRC